MSSLPPLRSASTPPTTGPEWVLPCHCLPALPSFSRPMYSHSSLRGRGDDICTCNGCHVNGHLRLRLCLSHSGVSEQKALHLTQQLFKEVSGILQTFETQAAIKNIESWILYAFPMLYLEVAFDFYIVYLFSLWCPQSLQFCHLPVGSTAATSALQHWLYPREMV